MNLSDSPRIMKFDYPSINISQHIAYALSAAIGVKLILTLRIIIPARVNCWFCNHNFWVPFTQRNSWDCRHCEQYNGFTKDGDYNKNICGSSENPLVPKNVTVFRTPPKNGLCRMCNINQELKVFQLANFVPMNENNFDDEVELYRLKLEKAYKLCSPCKKHVCAKLQSEKSKLLDAKVGESRSPKKTITKTTQFYKKSYSQNMARFILICICLYLFCIAILDVWKITDGENMRANITQGYKFLMGFSENVFSIIKGKAITIMPVLANYENVFQQLPSLEKMQCIAMIKNNLISVDWHMLEKLLSAAGCILQITCHCCEVNTVRHVSASDVVWAVNILSTLMPMQKDNVVLLLKFLSALSLLVLYAIKPLGEESEKFNSSKNPSATPKKIKNLTSQPPSKAILDSLSEDDDSGDDVSLHKFGLNNTNSSNEAKNSPNKQNGRTFSPFNRSSESLIWTSQKNMTTGHQFVSPERPRSAFVKPQPHFSSPIKKLFKTNPESETYQKPSNYDADLDRSISGLHLGSSGNTNGNSHRNIFTVHRFSCPTPTFVSPSTTPFSQSRPLISPSRFCPGTSWVAGGYWGSSNPSFPDEHLYSRSSSQSSGFESLASSMQHINVMNSCPPSRTNSICSEIEYCDPMRTGTTSNVAPQGVPLFHTNGMRPPVHPQMLFNNHVQIPQLPLQTNIFAPSNSFVHENATDWKYNQISTSHNQFAQSTSNSGYPVFTSRLIKLPNVKS